MDTVHMFIQFIILVLAIFFGYVLKELPSWIKERDIEKVRAENAMELQREAYFRQMSGEKIQKIFSDWTAFLFDTDNKLKKVERDGGFTKIFSEAVMYASDETISIIATFQRYMHSKQKEEDENDEFKIYNEDEISVYFVKVMYFIGLCIRSLKFDFTGYQISVDDLFSMKLSDFEELSKHEKYKKSIKEVDEMLKK